ncbi:MAG: hypothetical protein IPL61_13975 [Myxococcales bacterium]|nr:hypothetical protein [Myxococcales bacterium]
MRTSVLNDATTGAPGGAYTSAVASGTSCQAPGLTSVGRSTVRAIPCTEPLANGLAEPVWTKTLASRISASAPPSTRHWISTVWMPRAGSSTTKACAWVWARVSWVNTTCPGRAGAPSTSARRYSDSPLWLTAASAETYTIASVASRSVTNELASWTPCGTR